MKVSGLLKLKKLWSVNKRRRLLAEVVVERLSPLQSRYRELTADPDYLDSLLTEGALRIKPVAEKTLALVKDRVGLG